MWRRASPCLSVGGGLSFKRLVDQTDWFGAPVKECRGFKQMQACYFSGSQVGSATRVVQKAMLNGCCRITDLLVADPIKETSILQRSRSN